VLAGFLDHLFDLLGRTHIRPPNQIEILALELDKGGVKNLMAGFAAAVRNYEKGRQGILVHTNLFPLRWTVKVTGLIFP